MNPNAQLRVWRERAGLTQTEVAVAVDMSQPMISAIEGGQNTSIAVLRRLATLYKLSPAEAGALLVDTADEQVQAAAS